MVDLSIDLDEFRRLETRNWGGCPRLDPASWVFGKKCDPRRWSQGFLPVTRNGTGWLLHFSWPETMDSMDHQSDVPFETSIPFGEFPASHVTDETRGYVTPSFLPQTLLEPWNWRQNWVSSSVRKVPSVGPSIFLIMVGASHEGQNHATLMKNPMSWGPYSHSTPDITIYFLWMWWEARTTQHRSCGLSPFYRFLDVHFPILVGTMVSTGWVLWFSPHESVQVGPGRAW